VGEVRNLSPYAISPVLWVGFVGVLAIVALKLAPTRAGWAAAVTFSVLSPPRLLAYMFMTFLAAFRRLEGRQDSVDAVGAGIDPKSVEQVEPT
jgi:hypothetical protein